MSLVIGDCTAWILKKLGISESCSKARARVIPRTKANDREGYSSRARPKGILGRVL